MNRDMIEVSWPILKDYFDTNGGDMMLADLPDVYHIRLLCGVFQLGAMIRKTSPASKAQTEFEASYKSNTNPPPTQRVLQGLGDDTRYGFAGQSMHFQAPVGSSNHDHLFPFHASVQGGHIFCDSNATLGDSVKAQIVDTENTLGLRDIDAFGLGVGVVTQFLDWCAVPNHYISAVANDTSDLPAPMMTLRLVYNNTGLTTVNGILNLESYQIL